MPWFFFFLFSWIAREFLWRPQPAGVVLSKHQSIFWQNDGTIVDFLKQCLFLLKDNSKALIPQDWSLRVEMRAAIIVPILVWLTRMNRGLYLLVFSIALLILIPRTGHYYLSFVVGAYIAHIYTVRKIRDCWPLFSIVAGFLLYQAQWGGGFLPKDVPLFVSKDIVWGFSSIGCGLLVLGVLTHDRVRMVMEARFLRYLGRISYSLYLVHMVVLLCLGPWVLKGIYGIGIQTEFFQQILVVLGVSLVSFSLADLGERLVERPCIMLGKKISHEMKSRDLLTRFKI